MIEWFGDPRQPYAICLSCRVEVNGEEKAAKQQRRIERSSPNCLICEAVVIFKDDDICERCIDALNHLSTTKLLGRAQQYTAGKIRKPARKSKKLKRKNHRLFELVNAQRTDAKDRNLRFERAIEK